MRFLLAIFLINISVICFSQSKKNDKDCNATKRPIVFVHGFLGSGDNWAKQIQRFSSNGYCEERMFVFDWNSINRSKATDSLLNDFIDEVLKKTNATQVDLVGHSAGGGLCYSYLNDSLRATKVAHYVHIGSGKMKTAAGQNAEVATMNIYSTADLIAKSGGEIPGAINVQQTTADHFQVATSEETFLSLYKFFNNNQQPVTAKVIAAKEKYNSIGGKGVTLGENNPLSFDSVIAYSFNPATGKRIENKKQPATNSITGWMRFSKEGNWAFQLSNKTFTEFEVRPSKGRRVFYFFEPQVRTNKNMYLRTFPNGGMMAGVLNQLPKDEKQTVLVIFTSNQAAIAGRDTLAIDSIPISTAFNAPASKTMIAVFIFDDGDGVSSKLPLKTFSAFPFLGSMDLKIPADINGTMRIFFNGRSMVLPRRPSSEGVMIAVFE